MIFAYKFIELCSLTFIYCTFSTAVSFETSTVTTNAGTFVGYVNRVDALGTQLSSRRFLGIPYAEPPIGQLRFKKPQKKAVLTEPLEVTQYAPICAQQPIMFGGSRNWESFSKLLPSEDCLYLNVYTPFGKDDTKNLPVVIFIHGGAFVVGTPNIYPGDVFSAYGNVIVVTIAYRLSVWGFMSTGDDNLPGNYGLFDQQMAIQWVHENIEAFGGDPDLITLIGHSAGGASTLIQSMNPGNAGIIKRAVPMSGSITCFWGVNNDPLSATRRLGQLIGCDKDDTKELAECLQSQSTDAFVDILIAKENDFLWLPFDFIPVVDGDFIPETPLELIHGHSQNAQLYQNTIAGVDLISGIVSNEGLVMISNLTAIEDPTKYETTRKEFEEELVPEVTRRMFGPNVPDLVNNLVIGEYTNWSDPNDNSNTRESFVKLNSDYGFNIQNVEIARMHAKKSSKNTYMYLYDALTKHGLLPSPDWSNKPQHGDELYTMFGADFEDYVQYTTPYPNQHASSEDIELTKAHITLLSNFAYSGNPNEPVDVQPFIKTVWPTYAEDTQRYLTIDFNMSDESVGSMLFAREYNFWRSLVPDVLQAAKQRDNYHGQNEYCEKDCN